MLWSRFLVVVALSCAVILTALWVVPGTSILGLLVQAGFLLLIPWLIALVSSPIGRLTGGLLDAFRRSPRGGGTSARVLRSLGGLTWAAGLLGLWGSFLAGQSSLFLAISTSRTRVDVTPVIPGIVAAMLIPVAFALILRLALYDRAARALEAADAAREALPAN